MPIALETSKRKFHKLLDNLTTGSQPSVRQSPDSTPPSAKRLRLEARNQLNILAHKPGSLRDQAQVARLAADAAKAHNSSLPKAEEPNYNPWSHEHFLRRLRTFADLRLWTSKPDAINEVHWAKRGWICESVNKVACKGGCEQRVVVSLRPKRSTDEGQEIEDSEDYSVEVDETLVAKYVELIETGHAEECLWKRAGCKGDIYRLPIARPSIWQPQLRDRYKSFESMAIALPPLSKITHPFDLNEVAESLPPDFAASTSVIMESPNPAEASEPITVTDRTPISPSALAFALLGWKGTLDTNSYAIATCPACFRRLGLWLYAPKESSAPSPAVAQVPSNGVDDEGDDEGESMTLDLLDNHRNYCPWINATSQSMPGSFSGLAGWEILQRVVRNHAEVKVGAKAPVVAEGEAGRESGMGMAVVKDAKEVEREDKVRFARLKELTRTMGLKSLRNKLKGKDAVVERSIGKTI